ncbi:T9SS type A sorting domain-containing protein [Candidatus Nomurabacteria bacterium]|nr:T9SS type A sorting domain-containing protein [Candidatus Nomurabacteria bacterium]
MMAIFCAHTQIVDPSVSFTHVISHSPDSLDVMFEMSTGNDTATTGVFKIKNVATGAIAWTSTTFYFDTASYLLIQDTISFGSLGLNGNTQYEITLTVNNTVGADTSAPWPFTTPLDPGPPQITNIQVLDSSEFGGTVRVYYSTLDPAWLLFEWDYDGPPTYSSPTTVPVVGIGYQDFVINALADTTVFTHAKITGLGVDESVIQFKTLPIIGPTIMDTGIINITDSSATVYAIGDLGSSTMGNMECYVNGGLVGMTAIASGDTAWYFLTGLSDSTQYAVCFVLHTQSYGGDTSCLDFMTDPAPIITPPLPYWIDIFNNGNGEIGIAYSTEYSASIDYAVNVASTGCSATPDATIAVGHGTDTIYVQYTGHGEISVNVSITDSLGSYDYDQEDHVYLGEYSGPEFMLDDQFVTIQNGTHNIVLRYYDVDSVIYNLYVVLEDANQDSIGTTPLLAQQSTLIDGNTNMNIQTTDHFNGAIYMRVVGVAVTYLGPCGANKISSNRYQVGTPTGIQNISDVAFSVYPNPLLNGQGIIEVENAEEIKVCDVSGRIVWQQIIAKGKNYLNLEIDPGIYFIQIGNQGGSQKIIIQ